MRILCTGLSGFIGSALYQRLVNSNHEIAAITRHQKFKDCINFQSDLQTIKAIEKDIISFEPDILIHLAWEGIPNFTYSNCLKNINASTQLFELVTNNTPCRKIISTGSCFEYGKRHGSCKEDEILNINSLFSWSKNTLTNYLKYLYINNSMEYFWFSVFYAYGPKQRSGSLIPSIINSVQKK
jgi:nucleoside-diphosphate-sugar epimerase